MITLHGIEITPTIFPDKTSQVWKLPKTAFLDGIQQYSIVFDFEREDEIMHLCQLVDLIRHKNIPKPITLFMPYLPYGRQDKEISNETTFALHSFAKIINMLNFSEVNTLDAHSNIGGKLFNNFKSYYPDKGIFTSIAETNADVLAFPDKGASDRYTNVLDRPAIIGHKVRDQLTGYITEYKINGNPEGKNILIVDDICDKGTTFRLMAIDLYKAGAKSVHLYVSHALLTGGIDFVRETGIKRIFDKNGEVLDGHDS